MTDHVHTLRSIANENNRDKRTVQNWLARAKDDGHGELGTLINNVRMFTDAERDILASYAGADREPSPTAQATAAAPVSVEVGNHAMVLSAPQLPSQFSLETLRTSEVTAFDDPLAIANQALAIADQIQTAMDADLAQRQQRLNATQQANAELAKRVQDMKLKQLKYDLQASQIDQATTDRTMTLQESLAELTRLGKPQEPAPGA